MGQHREYTLRPARDGLRLAAGHALTLWDHLVGDLPKGSRTRRDIAWVAGFVITMLVLTTFSVLIFGDWSPQAAGPAPAIPRETVTVTVPQARVDQLCLGWPCCPAIPGLPSAPPVAVPVTR